MSVAVSVTHGLHGAHGLRAAGFLARLRVLLRVHLGTRLQARPRACRMPGEHGAACAADSAERAQGHLALALQLVPNAPVAAPVERQLQARACTRARAHAHELRGCCDERWVCVRAGAAAMHPCACACMGRFSSHLSLGHCAQLRGRLPLLPLPHQRRVVPGHGRGEQRVIKRAARTVQRRQGSTRGWPPCGGAGLHGGGLEGAQQPRAAGAKHDASWSDSRAGRGVHRTARVPTRVPTFHAPACPVVHSTTTTT
jgi:hypothetical protein